MDGMLVIRKEKGFTSHDVVAKLRRILGMKKIGHTGTLDPEAEGVLPVALGAGTKLVELFTEKEKTYETVLHLGLTTDTQDLTGTVLEEKEVLVTEEEVARVILSFAGPYMQEPPMYSALKVDGKKLYELAREGIQVERKPRPVTFFEIRILDMKLPRVRILVTCSKGTYIRTLCHDIGQKLGCGGCMEALLRRASGAFTLEDSHTLDEIQQAMEEGRIQEFLLPVEALLFEYPVVYCDEDHCKLLENGNPLSGEAIVFENSQKLQDGDWVRMYTCKKQFVALYQWKENSKRFVPVKMFFPGGR